ncbi:MAG TPA: L,D-transpeptidase family protein [Longimicrobiales bacterium]|nr:L,D-transpeptidase family protein [Longimicrobiales bacterium]
MSRRAALLILTLIGALGSPPALPGFALAARALAVGPGPLAAQAVFGTLPGDTLADDPVPRFAEPPLDVAGRYIVIRLADNRLYLMDGSRVLWSAPVATGTGFRLASAREKWTFVTPRGVFRVQRKEKDPVWIMPDWAFVEAGLPAPPPDSPSRRRRGMLGNTALYIGYELAIHGTDRPDLVLRNDPDKRRVSHGCIRMTDEDARELYHQVDVGTLVLIY